MDEDYNPLWDIESYIEFSDSVSENSLELNDELCNILDTSSTNEENFLDEVLQKFKKLNNKHDWSHTNSIEFAKNLLRNEKCAIKLFHKELDVIAELTLTYTGVKIYNKSCTKKEKVNHLISNLHKISLQEIENDTNFNVSSLTSMAPQTLFQCAKKKLLQKYYPKSFLEIAAAKCKLPDLLNDCETNSPLNLDLQICEEENDVDFVHVSYSYPNYSSSHKRYEQCTMDLTHILTNMRSQISRHGYDHVSKEAFLQVSDTDHNVLPRAIIEDHLDKQSSDLAKCFFSEEVENVLYQNKNYSKATFVHLTRNWHEACDKHGIATLKRLVYMQNMFNHLISWIDFTDFPLPSKYIRQMPIQTFEMILQNISTCMQLFTCSTEPINQRSVSTLAIESFSSELTQMEFTGIGCPKSVDIPRLISYVTSLNNI